MIDILGKRYYFFGLSMLLILPGLALLGYLAFSGSLPLSIDFTGGSLLEVSFDVSTPPQPAELIKLYEDLDIADALVQTTGQDTFVIRSSVLSDEARIEVKDALSALVGGAVTILRFESVGPTIGREVTSRAAQAVAVAAVIVVIYITWAFRGVEKSLRYGICAIIAMIHDVALVFSLTAVGSLFWRWEIDALFLTALLTVIGFSVQDKIVVFDRVRENSKILRNLQFEKLVNHSIVQTLQRSINTQLMTVEFMLMALALFGGVTLREFSIILLVGLFSGTYSSIFIAAPILVAWEKQEWSSWFRRRSTTSV